MDEEGVRSRSIQRIGRSRCSTSSCTPLGRLPRLTFIFDSNAARSRGNWSQCERNGRGAARWTLGHLDAQAAPHYHSPTSIQAAKMDRLPSADEMKGEQASERNSNVGLGAHDPPSLPPTRSASRRAQRAHAPAMDQDVRGPSRRSRDLKVPKGRGSQPLRCMQADC